MRTGIEAKDARLIRRRLLAWFDRHRRDLPWRRTRDPYAIWLSEMMLQQTQVATVVPYYERFLSRFPSLHSLARADLDVVLSLWSGLGYYARARNLHAAARMVVREFDGRFPQSVEAIRRLPGVGGYTAAAVVSTAFGVRAAAVDGNVKRVISRLFGYRGNVSAPRGLRRIQLVADALAPSKRCGDFNQAMMELGATVCLPRGSARCERCPLSALCTARRENLVARLPRKAARPAVKIETHVVAAIRRGDKWLVRRRPATGLWAGLWELPSARCVTGSTRRAAAALSRTILRRPASALARPFCEFDHQLTHRKVRFVGHVCRVRKGELTAETLSGDGSSDVRWLTVGEMEAAAMSKAMRVLLESLRESRRA